MENAADIKAWCEEHWNDKGVINARDRNVFVQGPGGIAIKAGSSPWYKSKEQKAYEARFGIYNKKLVPIILAEATRDDSGALPHYTWPKTQEEDDESKAKALGFYLDEKTGKWKHPAAPEYSMTRVKNCIEDHADIMKSREAVPRKRVPKAKLEQAAAIIAKVPQDELATFLAKFGLSLSLAASIASLDNAEMIARQFLRATL